MAAVENRANNTTFFHMSDTCVCMCVCMCVCVCLCVCIHTQNSAYIYIYIYIYTHTENSDRTLHVYVYIRGLSGKFPKISRKNFPVLPWSYSALSRFKVLPSTLYAPLPAFLQCSEAFLESFLGMLRKCASEFVLIDSIDSKRRLFSVDLSFGNVTKLSWCDIWRVRRLWKDSRVFGQEITDKERWTWGRVFMLEHPSILRHASGLFFLTASRTLLQPNRT